MKLLRSIAYSMTLSLIEDSDGKVFELQQDNLGNYFFLPIAKEHLPRLLDDWDVISAQELSDNGFFGSAAENWRKSDDAAVRGREKTEH